MGTLIISAPAKINLRLDILGKRPDGYHQLESIFQTVSLFDYITITKSAKGISLESNLVNLPNDERNIVYRACELMFRRYALPGGLNLVLEKNIPIGAGLGGGSSNAASVIKGLNKIFSLDLSQKELVGLALELGSDVPFFLTGGTAFVAGRGEIITTMTDLPEKELLLIIFPFSLSTARVYANWAPTKPRSRFVFSPELKWDNLMPYVGNELSEAAFSLRGEIREVLASLKEAGLGPAHISGSGPSIILYSNDKARVAEILKAYPLKIIPVKTLKKEF